MTRPELAVVTSDGVDHLRHLAMGSRRHSAPTHLFHGLGPGWESWGQLEPRVPSDTEHPGGQAVICAWEDWIPPAFRAAARILGVEGTGFGLTSPQVHRFNAPEAERPRLNGAGLEIPVLVIPFDSARFSAWRHEPGQWRTTQPISLSPAETDGLTVVFITGRELISEIAPFVTWT